MRSLLLALAITGFSSACATAQTGSVPAPGARPVDFVCVLQNRQILDVGVARGPADDTLRFLGAPGAAPANQNEPGQEAYAAEKEWFLENGRISLLGEYYVKFGLYNTVRPLADYAQRPEALHYVGEYDGVAAYADPAELPKPREIYLRFGPGCQFQRYAEISEVM